jgi:hypothetical protein
VEEKMKKTLPLIIFIMLAAVLPGQAFANTEAQKEIASVAIEGTIQGLNCISTGRTCPVGMEDPLIATERFFVLYTKKDIFYLVPNMDRAVLARHINQIVRITGKVHPKYQSMTAEKFEVLKDGNWKKTWPYKIKNHSIGVGGISEFVKGLP